MRVIQIKFKRKLACSGDFAVKSDAGQSRLFLLKTNLRNLTIIILKIWRPITIKL
ncbi:hypothetical protein FC07_GL001535 [Loigolactobacillus bifermentans DSM 20003]|uniref:Uncharacterized protein n=1 Tax=Loigolactobacillus bifermentans DSM 20003 TaxID=1423726 RepID=A0A0R1GFI7_9LACO|nr:hypothetical protein FC07_GL001535 [Loigolactobacillus bifermentans DSM 20003]